MESIDEVLEASEQAQADARAALHGLDRLPTTAAQAVDLLFGPDRDGPLPSDTDFSIRQYFGHIDDEGNEIDCDCLDVIGKSNIDVFESWYRHPAASIAEIVSEFQSRMEMFGNNPVRVGEITHVYSAKLMERQKSLMKRIGAPGSKQRGRMSPAFVEAVEAVVEYIAYVATEVSFGRVPAAWDGWLYCFEETGDAPLGDMHESWENESQGLAPYFAYIDEVAQVPSAEEAIARGFVHLPSMHPSESDDLQIIQWQDPQPRTSAETRNVHAELERLLATANEMDEREAARQFTQTLTEMRAGLHMISQGMANMARNVANVGTQMRRAFEDSDFYRFTNRDDQGE